MAKLTFDNAGNLYGTTTGFKGGLGLHRLSVGPASSQQHLLASSGMPISGRRFIFTTISIPLYFSE
jgi:hypothetical protein